MIYNPFQGITAANGQRQFVLPLRWGGQNQLMESLTWPGLLAECGLTSGSDKGPSEAELIRRLEEKRRKTTLPQPPDQFQVQWPEGAGQTEQLMWASFRLSELSGGRAGQPAQPPANIGIHSQSCSWACTCTNENGTFRTRARGGAEAHLAQVRPLQGKGQVE